MRGQFRRLVIIACTIALAACSPASLPVRESAALPVFPPPLIIAHRGARSLAPENTLAAARKALEANADMWELDVAVTADGELVVMHDNTLDRTCNVGEVFPDREPWLVRDFTLAEIQTLDCGSWFNEEDPFQQIKAGNVSEADMRSYVGEQAPTLRQALEFTRDNDWEVNVELKKQPSEELDQIIVEKAVALIEELAMDDGEQVVVSSFRHDYLEAVEERNPGIQTEAVTSKPIRNLPAYLTKLGLDGCNPRVTAWSYKRLGEMREQGIVLNVWTVNDELVMQALIKTGVHGIITDYPQTLTELSKQP